MSFKCFADWFRHYFPNESSDIKHSLILSQDKQINFSRKLNNLILKHHSLIPMFAGVLKELYCANDAEFLRTFYKTNNEKVVACIRVQNKARENDIQFWGSMFEIECYLINTGLYSFSYYIEAVATQLMCRNIANDIILMFTMQRCFYKLRKESNSFFIICMNYVKKIRNLDKKAAEGDLSYDEVLVDPGLKGMIEGIAAGKSRVEDTPCLTLNPLVQAKFFLKSVLADPAHEETYCKLFSSLSKHESNDFQLGFGWLVFYLNIICAAKLKEFYEKGFYYQENIEANKKGTDEAQSLLMLIMQIKGEGFLSYELQCLLAHYQIAAIII